MLLQYFCRRLVILRQGLNFQVLADRPETINFKLKFQSKLMISDPGAPGADFEDLTALSETWKINDNQWFYNTFPSSSFKKQ